MRSTSQGGWGRRETIRAGLAAAFAALGAFGQVIGAEPLRNVAAAFAVGFAFAALWTMKGRLGLDRGTEEATRRRHTRTDIAGIQGVDPTDVGVEAAASQGLLPGGAVPEYVPRNIDAALDRAIAAGLEDGGPWIVAAVGRSKVGKSRAMFEALKRYRSNELEFVAPVDADALEALLTPGERIELEGKPAVLWLDDMEPFLSNGVTFQTLQEWHRVYPKSIVTGIFGGKGSEDLSEIDATTLTTIAGDILQHSAEVLMQATTMSEIEPIEDSLSPADRNLIEKHGLAAYLVAAPELERKLTLMRGRDGTSSPAGAALVRAAAEWARCGRTDPIAETLMREIWIDYLDGNVLPSDERFGAGLDWALQPVAGSVALLERVGEGFRPHDYVVRVVDSQADHPPLDRAWEAAALGAADSEALTVATVAYAHDKLDVAERLFRRGSRSSSSQVAAIGGFNLGVTLRRLDRHEDAIEAYDTVIGRFGDADSQNLREQVARAMSNKAVELGRVGRVQEELACDEEVVARFAGSGEPAMDLQVAIALANKGVALGHQRRFEEQRKAFEEIIERFGDSEDRSLRHQVALGRVGRAAALSALDRNDEALETYEQVIDLYEEDAPPDLLNAIARGEAGRLIVLELIGPDIGVEPRAVEAFEQLVTRFGDSPDPDVQLQVARAMVNMGIAAGQGGDPAEALALFRVVGERFGRSGNLEVLEQAAIAAGNEGVALAALRRYDEVLGAYEAMLERFGDRQEPELRDQVAVAQIGWAKALGHFDRQQEELQAYRELIDRFADSDRPVQQEVAADAMNRLAAVEGRRGRNEESTALTRRLLELFGESEEPDLREQVGIAYQNLGTSRGIDREYERALEAFEESVERLRSLDGSSARENLGLAWQGRALALDELGRHAEALEAFDEILAGDWGDGARATELRFRGEVGRAGALGGLGRGEEELSQLASAAAASGQGEKPDMREFVAIAIGRQGAQLGMHERHEEAREVLELLIGRYEGEPEPRIQLEVARAMGNLSVALAKLGRDAEVPAVADRVVARYGEVDALRAEVAETMIKSAFAYQRLGEMEGVLRVTGELLERFGSERDEQRIVEQVARSMEHRVAALRALGRDEERRREIDRLVDRFGQADDLRQRQVVAATLKREVSRCEPDEEGEAYERLADLFLDDDDPELAATGIKALGARGALVAKEGETDAARPLLDEVIERCEGQSDPGLREQIAIALLNKAAGWRLQDRDEDAVTACEEVISRFAGVEDERLEALVKLARERIAPDPEPEPDPEPDPT